MYALNNGAVSDSTFSTFSPAATPFPGANPYAQYNPFQAFLEQSQRKAARQFTAGNREEQDTEAERGLASASIRSSPSHLPIDLQPKPFSRGRGTRKRDRLSELRSTAVKTGSSSTTGASTRAAVRGARPQPAPPPRVESTQPRETSPEPSSSGEETAGEGFEGMFERGDWQNVSGPGTGTGTTGTTTISGGEDSEWVDEENDEEDLLDLEFHTEYVLSIARRRKRWD